jgi:CRISPR/Cas system CSM-associated protein Csm3 (group 7 of RAMP superfamily)
LANIFFNDEKTHKGIKRMSEEKIIEKYMLMGEIQTLSPLHIGSGDDERSDMDILLDRDNKPFIPATSFIGVLRQMILPESNDFWGFVIKKNNTDKRQGRQINARQSRVHCSDLICAKDAKFEIVIRDGICINHTTGIVEKEGKFTYEVLSPGARFTLKMAFDVTSAESQFTKQMIATIVDVLKNHTIQKDGTCRKSMQLGAKTNNGLGKFRLKEHKLYRFDFIQKPHVFRWITQTYHKDQRVNVVDLGQTLSVKTIPFIIKAHFHLKHSIIIRSYSVAPEMPDATHLKSGDDWVLSGSSIKGAIRSRAERILNTLNVSAITINHLFGFVPKRDDAKKGQIKAKKGCVQVSETILPKFVSELQTRIKIDRLTGGTIDTALFDTMPVFSDMTDKEVIITIYLTDKIDQWKACAGLLLLVLKDLWTGDLAIGGEKNIGRGTLKGTSASIMYEGRNIHINQDFKPENLEDQRDLENLVSALNSGGNNEN